MRLKNNRQSLQLNLWGACSLDLDSSVIAITSQLVAISVIHDSQQVFISSVYASTSLTLRRDLSRDLGQLQADFPAPWIFIGDFSAILGAHEVRGSRFPYNTSCADFQGWTDAYQLTLLLTRGAEYTWTNGRQAKYHIEKYLDRAICNNDWLNYWSSISCCTLTRSQSDHHPLLRKVFVPVPLISSFWPCGPVTLIVKGWWGRFGVGTFLGCPMAILSKVESFEERVENLE